MKIAIISDIHSNLEALKVVLDDIKSKGINKIYCLGDIISKGSHPKECIDLIRENCEIVLEGNNDKFFIEGLDNRSEYEKEKIKWNHSRLNNDDLDYLKSLPFCHEFYLSGRLIRLLHAHPKSNNKFAGNIDYLKNIYELVLPSENTISNLKADVLIYGHMHVQYVQKIYNRYIINPGSVGNALDVFRNLEKDANVKFTTVANYLILDGNLDSKDVNDRFSFELVSIPYDIEKELSSSKDIFEYESYSEELRNGKYRDMNKIYNSFKSRGIDKDDV